MSLVSAESFKNMNDADLSVIRIEKIQKANQDQRASNGQGNDAQTQAISLLKNANEGGAFDDVPFETVWSLLQATAKAAD